ncbi:hypothetical protein QYF36_000519 [Acer negundo]|nr:hypothetical protein QYF36_000519 [Acer negundo]
MICDGLDIGYFSNKWIYHGELDSTRARLNNDQSSQVDDMHGMLHNAFGVIDGGGGGECDGVDLSSLDNDNSGGGGENDNGGDRDILNDDARRFYNLLKDAEQELYPGCDDAPSAPSGTEIFQQMSLVKLYHQGDLHVNKDLKWLAQGPNKIASGFKKYLINGFSFQIKDIDILSKTQNSGVVIAKTSSFASIKDKNPIVGDVSYFGHLIEVIELDYYRGRKVALFKCDWIDIKSNRGIKKDELGFKLVNPSCLLKIEEPFILASQAIQVFYFEDHVDTEWHAIVFTKPRDLYDMDEVANVANLYVENESGNTENLQELMDNTYNVRDNLPRIMLDLPLNIIEEGDIEDQYRDETDN